MKNYSHSAIVTDGLWRKSLSAVRSLGKAGFHVSVMGDSVFTTGFWSKFTRKKILSASAANDAEKFGSKLLILLKTYSNKSRPVIFPMEDATLMWIARNIDEIAPYGHVLIPPLESLNIAQDKGATAHIAKELDIPCPQTWEPQNLNDFTEIIKELKQGEFVVKPKSGTGSSGVIYGEFLSPEGWRNHWRKFGQLLVQERIPQEGHGLGVALLMDREGECTAHFVHERLQQYPVSGGPSTDRQSIYYPQLVDWSIKLLKKLSWRGIAMVEWKDDVRDGTPKLMEINPRFWGSLELAVRAGVDFPVLYAKAALGEELGTVPEYPDGIRCRWMIPGEILRYLSQPKDERESLREFAKGLPYIAEEWDKSDIRGVMASIVCPAVLLLNPRYWKYLRRRA